MHTPYFYYFFYYQCSTLDKTKDFVFENATFTEFNKALMSFNVHKIEKSPMKTHRESEMAFKPNFAAELVWQLAKRKVAY